MSANRIGKPDPVNMPGPEHPARRASSSSSCRAGRPARARRSRSLAQSLHAMQCVRLVLRGKLGTPSLNSGSWLAQSPRSSSRREVRAARVEMQRDLEAVCLGSAVGARASTCRDRRTTSRACTASRRRSIRPGSLASKLVELPVGATGGVIVAGHDDGGLLAARQVPEARQRRAVEAHLRDQVRQQPLLLVGLRDVHLSEVHPVVLARRRRTGRPSAPGCCRRAPARPGRVALARVDDRACEVVGERGGLPPAAPTLRSVTAGDARGRRSRRSTASRRVAAPASVQRSAAPWNCIVSLVMPAPGGSPCRPSCSRPRGRASVGRARAGPRAARRAASRRGCRRPAPSCASTAAWPSVTGVSASSTT